MLQDTLKKLPNPKIKNEICTGSLALRKHQIYATE
jgi:hypothetical protein